MSKVSYGTGRRKSSVARVTLLEGEGKFTFNGKSFEHYFPTESMRTRVAKPLVVAKLENKFDLQVNVTGSGLSAQAEAVSLGLARALVEYDSSLRNDLKKAGLLTRDARKVERKKYGLKKARRAEQYTKR